MRKISVADKIKFAFFGVAVSTALLTITMILNFFMQSILLIDDNSTEIVIGVSRAAGMALALFSGFVIQRVRLKKGRYRPWIDLMKWPAAASVILMFVNTAALPVLLRIAIVSVCCLILYTSTGFMVTAQYMLLTQMAGSDMRERSRLTILSMQFGLIVPLAFSYLFTPLSMTGLYDALIGNSFMFARAVFGGAVLFAGALLLSSAAKKYDPPRADEKTQTLSFKEMAGGVFANKNFLIVLLARFLAVIAESAPTMMTVYYFMYVMNNPSLMAAALSTIMFGRLATAVVAPILGVRLGKKKSAVLGLLCYGLLSICILLFAKLSVYVYFVLMCLMHFTTYLYTGFLPLYLLDSAEYGFHQTGKDNRAAVMGLSGVPGALASFALPFLVPFALGLLGYTNGMSSSAAVNLNLMWAIGGIPAVFALLAAAVMHFGYGISDGDAERFARENEGLGVDGDDMLQ